MAVNLSSFLAGAGTLLVTMAVGFGGGILLTDAIAGKSEAQQPGQLQQQGREAKSPSHPAAATVVTSPAAERPVVHAVGIQQPHVTEAKSQTGDAFTPSQAARPAHPEDAQAKASEAEIQREARRQEHVKRAQSKALAERKRRKSEAMRAMANRAKREATRGAEGEGQEQPRQPEFNFGRRADDGNPFGGPFRMN